MFCVVIIVVTNKNEPMITNKIVLIKQLSLPLIEFIDTVLENNQAVTLMSIYIRIPTKIFFTEFMIYWFFTFKWALNIIQFLI